jgi:hypothetical protein
VPGGGIGRLCDGAFQARDLLQQLDFGRNAVGALQNRIRHPQVFRGAEVLLEVQRLANAGQVLELTLRHRLPDAVLRDTAERHRPILTQLVK